ncbi:MAG: AAA family ATPase [Deltaproteobacteria bacterium]|nr:AAA family ATPase [Deltaproteobacteria bacterium]
MVTTPSSSPVDPSPAELLARLNQARAWLDSRVMGQAAMKEALWLAVAAGEHVYLEGLPGTAKTYLAESAALALGLPLFFHPFHRDTRLADLVGDPVIRREKSAKGEVVAQGLRRGGLLTARLAVLDDITRAPGEALNVLLRLLNERQYGGERLPLVTALATSNPPSEHFPVEALDPAHMDRFLLQVRVTGAVVSNRWEEAGAVMARHGMGWQGAGEQGMNGQGINRQGTDGNHTADAPPQPLGEAGVAAIGRAVAQVEIPPLVRRAYLAMLRRLLADHACTSENSLLTDRTFLAKVPRLIQAAAFLRGSAKAHPADLAVLNHVLTFRVPPPVAELFREMTEELPPANEEVDWREEEDPGEGGDDQAGMEGQPGEDGDEEGQGEDGSEQAEGPEGDDPLDKLSGLGVGGSRGIPPAPAPYRDGADLGDPLGPTQQDPQDVERMEVLIDSLSGRMDRNRVERERHLGGSPRRWRAMRTLDEVIDTDPADMALWMDRPNPRLPRAHQREKRHVGGEVVIVRDISQSMEGRFARWTSSVIVRLVDLVKSKRLRLGYIEFNHGCRKHTLEGQFFTRDYDQIIRIASRVSCAGVTNYQMALKEALDELKGQPTRNRHILFLTDGEPTQGDWLVREERRRAKGLGVPIHTLFIGSSECPEILDTISQETGGGQFVARPNPRGGLTLDHRTSRVKAYKGFVPKTS